MDLDDLCLLFSLSLFFKYLFLEVIWEMSVVSIINVVFFEVILKLSFYNCFGLVLINYKGSKILRRDLENFIC